ncbi:MAG: hypothetical protein EOP61_19085 [Sphingomonadales bacterium]|nr:MAG: hypothetical protein EOP61_19085 [Sphingomonadales bacterium]
MKRLFLLVGVLAAAAACESGPEEVAAKEPLFVTDDCALISAIGRERYDLSRDDPPMSVRLNGEDAPWTPGCDWQASGFNLVQVSGPEGEAATPNMSRLTFNRPRYDDKGALVRTSITAGDQTTAVLCRVVRGGSGWSVDECGADPKLTQPRAVAPTPADQTPDSELVAPSGDRPLTARDLTTQGSDPGAPLGTPN